MDKQETIVYELKGLRRYSKDGHFVDLPADWEFVPSGDPALTRRLKATAPDYWIVKRKVGNKEFGVGLCVPKGLADGITEQLKAEREMPEYQRKLEAGRRRREKEQEEYQEDFEQAVLQFLDFHSRYRELAAKLAKTITEFTTPVMRHNTTDYDHRYIPRVAGKRREVRRDLAHESLALLEAYRRGDDAPADCPLQRALNTMKQEQPRKSNVPKDNGFWL